MRNKMKIWFISGSSSDIREISVSKGALTIVLFMVLAAASFIAWAGHDYYILKKTTFNNDLLSKRILAQNAEIQSQRTQIKTFADEINSLKERFTSLAAFEEKIRIMADLEMTDEATGLFGIGGIETESLDPAIPLTRKHNSLVREMHQQTRQIDVAARKKITDFQDLLTLLEKKRNLLASNPSIRPVKEGGWYSSRFGYRNSPFTGRREFHSGLDIAARFGTEVIATAQGKVSYAKKKMLLGNLVIIDHGHGMITKYGHLSKILVKQGDTVKRGDVVGLLGNTGRSTGPHVHYEVNINGAPVNPEKYIID